MTITRRQLLRLLAAAPLARIAPAGRWLAFGDSITVGIGASDLAHGWASRVAAQCGQALDNRAVSGTGVAEHLAAIGQADVQPADTVLWLTGFNDQWRGTPIDQYAALLARALALVPGAYVGTCLRQPPDGYAAMPGQLGSDARVAAFNVVIAAAVRAAGCHLVDACAAYDVANCADLVHPTDAGHAQIAHAFLTTMRRIVYLPHL